VLNTGSAAQGRRWIHRSMLVRAGIRNHLPYRVSGQYARGVEGFAHRVEHPVDVLHRQVARAGPKNDGAYVPAR